MSYSIAVPAFNEAATLENRLWHLLDVAPPGLHEVVVADSLSADETAAVVEGVAASDQRVRLVTATSAGKPTAWNSLMAEVRTDTVVFIDADVTPTVSCIPALLRSLADLEVIVVGGRRIPRAADRTGRLTNLLHDPVIEMCLAGPAYAVRRGALLGRMREQGHDSMPDVFGDDNWILSLLRRGDFAVVDDATVEVDMSSRAGQRLISARRRLVAHEVHTARPAIGANLDAHHPEALRPLAQARHVARGDYSLRRKARWFAAGVAKTVADVASPVGRDADDLIARYKDGPSLLLRGAGSTTCRPVEVDAVVRRPASPDDAGAYARLENLAAGGGSRRLFGRRWPNAVEAEFRNGATRHSARHVECAAVDGEVIGLAAVVPHDQWRSERPPRLRGVLFQAWRRRRHQRPTPITTPGEATLATIAVDPRAQGAGVGRLLLEGAVERAHDSNASGLLLEAAPANGPALALYRGAGFVELATRHPQPSVLLMKPLGAAARRRVDWHQEYHRCGFITETFRLDDPSACERLAGDGERFESVVEGARRRGRAVVPYRFTPAIERIARDPAIVGVVEAVLRTDRWVVWGPNIRRDTPNDAHRWHVDLESWYWPSVTVAVALAGCAPDAATWFLPGTAALAVAPSRAVDDSDDAAVQLLARRRGCSAEPRRFSGLADGRFGVFDAKTWHRGDRSTSAGRTMLFLHYQRADEPRVPLMADHERHVWSRTPAPYRTFDHPASDVVARPPLRELARRLDHAVRR